MKIFIPKVKESWVVDRFRKEWLKNNKDISTNFKFNASIIWLIAPWVWYRTPIEVLKDKKVVCTIHHIDKSTFFDEIKNFKKLDSIVDAYHVISKKTKNDLREITKKEIFHMPFWVNQEVWFQIKDKDKLRKKYGFNTEDFLIGSFQRDTEGSDLVSPRLIKGPDLFIKLVSELYETKKNIKVVLTGTRRQYIISELNKLNIPIKYFEMVSQAEVNELYNLLDLYLVTSRIEGGPQSIVECAQIKTPILSTDVGIASEILDKKSIFNLENFGFAESNIEVAYKNVQQLNIPNGMYKYNRMFQTVNEN